MADLPDNQLNRKISDSESVGKEIDAFEAELASLRVAYEQYFLGVERQPPNKQHADLKRQLQKLKTSFVRQTAIKFRIQNIQNKYLSYERLWSRTLQEMENGTYRRDLFKAKLHSKVKEPPKPAAPAPAPAQPAAAGAKAAAPTKAPAPTGAPAGAPAPGAPPASAPASRPPLAAAAKPAPSAAPAPVAAGQNLTDAKLRAVYDAYVTAKKRCNEDTSKLSYDSVATNLRKQVPELMKKHNAQGVEFKVVIKDGKAILRAVPK